MAARRSDPHKLDVAALAADARCLEGQADAYALERWRDMQTPPADVPLPAVRWSARGELRRRSGEAPQIWLRLQVSAQAWLTCQRCLHPFAAPLGIERAFHFVPTEGEAEALDADSEDDVLALEASFDLIALIEDELLLAWPLVPLHERCSQPAHAGSGEPAPAASPFAALATLKGGRAAKP